MADIKQTIKEPLVGKTVEPPMTTRIRSHFMRHAREDSETGDLHMAQEDFINAIAPKHEDYVSFMFRMRLFMWRRRSFPG